MHAELTTFIRMHVDSLFRPIELAYQLAPVQDAAKHGGLKQIVHLPGMVACMGDEPNHFIDEALGEELDHLQARGFNEVFLTLLVHLALPDVLQRTGDNGRPKGGQQVVLVSFYFEEAPTWSQVSSPLQAYSGSRGLLKPVV